MRVAILGAGGFVGSAVYQRLRDHEDFEPVPVVRRLASAWPLLRLRAPLVLADVGQPDALATAISDCDAVVNCALGPSPQLPHQMEGILSALRRQGVRRLVHLSSVTVYGDRPQPDAIVETGAERAKKRTYGWYKARQDSLILQAKQQFGLEANILCLPQVTGPRSRFLTSVVEAVASGRLRPLFGGPYPCSLVDVDDVCEAIVLALRDLHADGTRTFVCNQDGYTWDQLFASAVQLMGTGASLQEIDPASLVSPSKSIRASLKRILAHPDIRQELKSAGLGQWPVVRWLKPWLRGNPRRQALHRRSSSNLEMPLMRQQLRNCAHSPAKAEATWGWRPAISSAASFDRFASQYRRDRGWDGEFGHLYRQFVTVAES